MANDKTTIIALFEMDEIAAGIQLAVAKRCFVMAKNDGLKQAIRKIEYSRYHINPEGYMMRISSFSHR